MSGVEKLPRWTRVVLVLAARVVLLGIAVRTTAAIVQSVAMFVTFGGNMLYRAIEGEVLAALAVAAGVVFLWGMLPDPWGSKREVARHEAR